MIADFGLRQHAGSPSIGDAGVQMVDWTGEARRRSGGGQGAMRGGYEQLLAYLQHAYPPLPNQDPKTVPNHHRTVRLNIAVVGVVRGGPVNSLGEVPVGEPPRRGGDRVISEDARRRARVTAFFGTLLACVANQAAFAFVAGVAVGQVRRASARPADVRVICHHRSPSKHLRISLHTLPAVARSLVGTGTSPGLWSDSVAVLLLLLLALLLECLDLLLQLSFLDERFAGSLKFTG